MRNNQEITITAGIERVDIGKDRYVFVFVNKTSDYVPTFSGKMGAFHMKYETENNVVFVRF